MRFFLLLLLASTLTAQSADLENALLGKWAGTLEYRDYSEPAGSTKRVKLPTWLAIQKLGEGLQFQYVYDDGPAKTVTETALLRIDGAKAVWGKESFAVEGLGKLREGRGTLILRGPGKENDRTVEVRTSVRVGRNILEITRETGAFGEPMAFRHTYIFVRAVAPVVP